MAHPHPPSHPATHTPAARPPPRPSAAPPLPGRAPSPGVAPAERCFYEDVLSPAQAARVVQAALGALPARVYARALVVQVGSGRLATQLAADHVVGLDASRALLGRAQRRLALGSERTRFTLLHGSLLQAPLADASFDLVVVDECAAADAGPGDAALLRLAIDARLAPGGQLLLLRRQLGRDLLPAHPCLHAQAFRVGDQALHVASYVRLAAAAPTRLPTPASVAAAPAPGARP